MSQLLHYSLLCLGMAAPPADHGGNREVFGRGRGGGGARSSRGPPVSHDMTPLGGGGGGAGGRAVGSFWHRVAAPGEHRMGGGLADDALEGDNQRWRGVPLRESIRAVCSEGKPGEAR